MSGKIGFFNYLRLKKPLFIFFILLILLQFKSAFADFQLQAGNLQLNVNGILLDIEQNSIIDNISFDSNSFTVTMSASQTFKISSSESRGFTVSPSTNISITCPAGKSVLTITMPSSGNPIDFIVTPGSPATCSTSDGGGGGGGIGAQPPSLGTVVPPPILPPLPPLPPPPALPPPPVVVPPPIKVPPAPPPTVTPPAAPPLSPTVESAQTIGSGAVNIGSSIGEGAIQILQGLAGGQRGFANIVINFPNIGAYIWDTNKPLLFDSNSNLKKLVEGSDYTILVYSASLGNVRDISDSYFSFIRPKNLSSIINFTKSQNYAYLLENPLLTVKAQETQSPSIKVIAPNGGEVWNIGGTYEIKWASNNLDSNHLVNIAIYKEHVFFGVQDTIKIINNVSKEVSREINKLRQDKEVLDTVKNVAVPVSVAVTVATAGALTVTATAGSATFAVNLSELFQLLSFSRFYLLGFIRFKKKKPWGRVYDKLAGKPLQFATVQIYESEFKKLKDSQVTDNEGRFGALVGPGKYYIKVFKKGFQTFQGDIIEISSPDQILNFELYLSPIVEEWNLEFLKKINVLNALKRFIELINPYLLALGTIISAISVVILPNQLNYGVFFIYIILDLLKIYFAVHLLKPFGKVIDETTNDPLPLTIVRIFEENKNWLLATKVTDELGRFNFLLAPGQYYLTFSRAGYQPFHSDAIFLKKAGLPSLNVKLKRAE